MATVAIESSDRQLAERAGGAWLFTAAALSLALAAWLLAGWTPIGFSIVTVFLFAGPHNWMEGRYMMARMPARWGSLRPYFLTGICGVLLLTAAFAALPAIGRAFDPSDEQWLVGLAIWDTLFVGWLTALIWMRSRQNPKRDWAFIYPIAAGVVGLAWLAPQAWSLALVYVHPLIALWFLDREIAARQPVLQAAYRGCLAVVAVLVVLLWARLAGSPNLPGNDLLTTRITSHAGAGVLHGVSSHLLVATHTFLEMLHYGVWLVAIPLVSLRCWPWQIGQTPLGRRSRGWKWALAGVLAVGALVTVGFWAGFLSNYAATRDVYFTVAMLHVLAEAPFLLRLI